MRASITVPACLYCDQGVEQRTEPAMTGPDRDYWIHVTTRRSACRPGFRSTDAFPHPSRTVKKDNSSK